MLSGYIVNTQNRINTTKTVQNYVHQSMVCIFSLRRFQESLTDANCVPVSVAVRYILSRYEQIVEIQIIFGAA